MFKSAQVATNILKRLSKVDTSVNVNLEHSVGSNQKDQVKLAKDLAEVKIAADAKSKEIEVAAAELRSAKSKAKGMGRVINLLLQKADQMHEKIAQEAKTPKATIDVQALKRMFVLEEARAYAELKGGKYKYDLVLTEQEAMNPEAITLNIIKLHKLRVDILVLQSAKSKFSGNVSSDLQQSWEILDANLLDVDAQIKSTMQEYANRVYALTATSKKYDMLLSSIDGIPARNAEFDNSLLRSNNASAAESMLTQQPAVPAILPNFDVIRAQSEAIGRLSSVSNNNDQTPAVNTNTTSTSAPTFQAH